MKHGVYVTKTATSTTAPEVAGSGIPFYIGAAPVQGASSPAAAGGTGALQKLRRRKGKARLFG